MNATRNFYGALIAIGVALSFLVPACTESADSASTYDPAVDEAGIDGMTASGDSQGGPLLPLCDALGGYDGVRQLAQTSIANLNGDCRIGPYFSALTADDKQHHADCFETFLAASAQCTDGTGAKIAYVGSKDSKGTACKAIPQAHQALGLTKDDYSAFQQDVVAALTAANATPDAKNGLLGILNGQPGVYNANKKGNKMCTPGTCQNCVAVPVDAGDGGDAMKDSAMNDAADGN